MSQDYVSPRKAPRPTRMLAWMLLGIMPITSMAQTTTPTPTSTTTTTTAAPKQFGTFARPFHAQSLWNSRPVNPVLGTFEIPKSSYYPAIGPGSLSSAAFEAKTGDKPMVVYGRAGTKGLWDPDAEAYKPSITIPRWPANTLAATGDDGHADIVDTVSGITHSFWQLKKVDGKWVATTYAWTRTAGTGWGEVAHYYQGARAVGVAPLGGMIRLSEINDGKPIFEHALAMSLTFNGLSPSPAYVFPATSADGTAATTNTGKIPEGALMMLPPNYDTSKIANADLRKVAETLKVYGAYVVDRNFGTPYYIYVENGADYNLHKGGWNNAVAAELDRIRANLRQVVSQSGFIDGNGKQMTPPKPSNLLSMRGPWVLQSGPALGTFDTWSQSVVFPVTGATRIVQQNYSKRSIVPLLWSKTLADNETLRLTVYATNGAKMRIVVRDAAGKNLVDTGEVGDKETARITWPVGASLPIIYTMSGVNGASNVRGILERVNP